MDHITGPFVAGPWGDHIRNLSQFWRKDCHCNLVIQKPTSEISESLSKIATNLLDLKIQVDCLAAMVLQNRPTLDIITASLGGTWAMLRKECHFNVNKSGEIQNSIK
jgi:hypothetical protein